MNFDRFHDLRHSHTAILLKGAVHPKIVGERLGALISALPSLFIIMSCGGLQERMIASNSNPASRGR